MNEQSDSVGRLTLDLHRSKHLTCTSFLKISLPGGSLAVVVIKVVVMVVVVVSVTNLGLHAAVGVC